MGYRIEIRLGRLKVSMISALIGFQGGAVCAI